MFKTIIFINHNWECTTNNNDNCIVPFSFFNIIIIKDNLIIRNKIVNKNIWIVLNLENNVSIRFLFIMVICLGDNEFIGSSLFIFIIFIGKFKSKMIIVNMVIIGIVLNI